MSAVLWFATACDGASTEVTDAAIEADGDAGADTCAVESIASCFVGDFFADCGGVGGDPVLACTPTEPSAGAECRWFAHGCVPTGYAASSCPPDDLCCDADWPFAEPGEPAGLYTMLNGFGTLPWDRQRAAAVSVTVDPGLSVTTTAFTCTGTDPTGGQQTPCTGFPGFPLARLRDTLALALPGEVMSGWYVWAEVDLHAVEPVARVCTHAYVDYSLDTCPDRSDVACATSGSMVLSLVPAAPEEISGMSVALDVAFAGGFRLEGSFALP